MKPTSNTTTQRRPSLARRKSARVQVDGSYNSNSWCHVITRGGQQRLTSYGLIE